MDSNQKPDGPIRTPPPSEPAWILERDPTPIEGESIVRRLYKALGTAVREPVLWFRENVVEANRGEKYYWYHRKYKRALPIDECYVDDLACIYEANIEYRRDLQVDRETLNLLMARRDHCYEYYPIAKGYYNYYAEEECRGLLEAHAEAEVAFHTKYGDMRRNASVAEAFNKQKHRMIMERRLALKKQREEEEQARAQAKTANATEAQ